MAPRKGGDVAVAKPKGDKGAGGGKVKKIKKEGEYPKIKVEDGQDKTEGRKRKREDEGQEGPDKGAAGKQRFANCVDAEGKPDWKKLRLESKRLKESRKKKEMKPEIYEVVKGSKKIWEELRMETCTGEQKEKLLNKLHTVVKDHIKRLSSAHDTVRVIETLYVLGTKPIREDVFKAFQAKEDMVYLMKSKYGRYLAMKLISHSSKEQRELIFKAMEVNIVQLLKHRFGSEVLNNYFSSHASFVEKSIIMKECYAPLLRLETSVGPYLKEIFEKFPQKKESIMKHVKELITFLMEKNMKKVPIQHFLMHQYLENCEPSERPELIIAMRENLMEIAMQPEGARLTMNCLWHGAPKDRKVILKTFKTKIVEMSLNKNAHMCILAAMDCVDDTVLVKKAIVDEMINGLQFLAASEYGIRVLSYLLRHRSPYFFDPQIITVLSIGDNNEYTKKPIEQRIKDLGDDVMDELLGAIVSNFKSWATGNKQLLFVSLIFSCYNGIPFTEQMEVIGSTITGHDQNELLIENRAIEMLTKFILTELSEDARLAFAEAVLKHLSKTTLEAWLKTNRGCFLLLRIWEKCGEENSAPGKQVKSIVKSNKKILESNTTAGAKLLKAILTKK